MDVDMRRVLSATAERQHALVTTHQAGALLGRSRRDYLVRTRQLVPVQPGVYRIAGSAPTWHQSLAAAMLAARGIVSHQSAAELWGLLSPRGEVEVSVPARRNPRLWHPARAHRILDLRLDLAVDRWGLRL